MNRNTPDNEAYFAAYDPQNAPSDDDLAEEEWKTERETTRFQRWIALWIVGESEENIKRLASNAGYLGEWLTEQLEDMA